IKWRFCICCTDERKMKRPFPVVRNVLLRNEKQNPDQEKCAEVIEQGRTLMYTPAFILRLK
ncbi:MAG: hypothetical protein ACTTJT_06410, partial [Pyramidobacter piscolens]